LIILRSIDQIMSKTRAKSCSIFVSQHGFASCPPSLGVKMLASQHSNNSNTSAIVSSLSTVVCINLVGCRCVGDCRVGAQDNKPLHVFFFANSLHFHDVGTRLLQPSPDCNTKNSEAQPHTEFHSHQDTQHHHIAQPVSTHPHGPALLPTSPAHPTPTQQASLTFRVWGFCQKCHNGHGSEKSARLFPLAV
jgi:hypothetical protein